MLGLSIIGLLLTYLLQQFNFLNFFYSIFGYPDAHSDENFRFVFNKSLRFLINDTLMVFIIWLIFLEKVYVRVAIVIQLIGLFILLPTYFFLKLTYEGTSEISSPLLSFFHRLIINPTLLILLIPAIYYSRRNTK